MTTEWLAETLLEQDPQPLVRPSLVFTVVNVTYLQTTCPCFDNLEFDIFDASGPQCHFITSVTIAARIRTLSVYYFKLNFSFLKSK